MACEWAFCDVMDLPPLLITHVQPEDCHAHSITGTRGAEHLVPLGHTRARTPRQCAILPPSPRFPSADLNASSLRAHAPRPERASCHVMPSPPQRHGEVRTAAPPSPRPPRHSR